MPDTNGCLEAHRRLLDRLRYQALDVNRLAGGLHENHLSKRLFVDRWSLKELLCHISRVQQVFLNDRLDAVLAQDNPDLVAYEPEHDPKFHEQLARPGADLLADYLAERERLIGSLTALSKEQWHRPGRHPVYPESDVCSLAEYFVHHEAHHIYQMFQRRALMGRVAE
jgi:hypothetical protein